MEPLHFRSNAARAPDTSNCPIFNRVLAPSLRSVTNWVLTHFAHSHLGGGSRFAQPRTWCSVTSFLHISGGAISLRLTTKWVSLASLRRTLGGRPHFARSLTIIRFPFNRTNVWDHATPSLLLSEIILPIAPNFDLRKKEGGNSDCSTISTFT